MLQFARRARRERGDDVLFSTHQIAEVDQIATTSRSSIAAARSWPARSTICAQYRRI